MKSSRLVKKYVSLQDELFKAKQAMAETCHFPGGKVYDKMPFDQPETITRLGEKLLTRIKDEKEQRLIHAFLRNRKGKVCVRRSARRGLLGRSERTA
jgi:hypothetical protein